MWRGVGLEHWRRCGCIPCAGDVWAQPAGGATTTGIVHAASEHHPRRPLTNIGGGVAKRVVVEGVGLLQLDTAAVALERLERVRKGVAIVVVLGLRPSERAK